MRRRPLLPLDKLILGASPNKLKTDSPAASPREAVPLSQKERARLIELSTREGMPRLHPTQKNLTPAEKYELQQLLIRRRSS